MTAFIGNFISKSSAPLESHASVPWDREELA